MGLTTRHIRLIRHGKSAAGGADRARPLNDRGRADGAAMQQWLSRQPHAVSWVWSSDAERAHSTAEFVAAATGARLILEPALYLADAETLLSCLRQTPPQVTSTALVAHNPGMTYCANLLSPAPVTDNLVTFGTALFEFQGDWPDLNFGNAELISLDVPRQIRGRG